MCGETVSAFGADAAEPIRPSFARPRVYLSHTLIIRPCDFKRRFELFVAPIFIFCFWSKVRITFQSTFVALIVLLDLCSSCLDSARASVPAKGQSPCSHLSQIDRSLSRQVLYLPSDMFFRRL